MQIDEKWKYDPDVTLVWRYFHSLEIKLFCFNIVVSELFIQSNSRLHHILQNLSSYLNVYDDWVLYNRFINLLLSNSRIPSTLLSWFSSVAVTRKIFTTTLGKSESEKHN